MVAVLFVQNLICFVSLIHGRELSVAIFLFL